MARRPDCRSSRERLLDAALDIARERGAASLSLDAVAARAGLSKGGLLYNFPTKAALMQALVERYVEGTRRALAAAEAAHGDAPNPLARAVLEVRARECGEDARPGFGAAAAIAENPALLEPVRRLRDEILSWLRSHSADPIMAMIAFLCVEGIRAGDLWDLPGPTAAEREAVIARLAGLLEAGAGGPADDGGH
jgi:AcrR family transcriptional regulator